MPEVTMRLWRRYPKGGEFTEYVMPWIEGEVVLDVIHGFETGSALDLAYRWNCKAGKCWSCPGLDRLTSTLGLCGLKSMSDREHRKRALAESTTVLGSSVWSSPPTGDEQPTLL